MYIMSLFHVKICPFLLLFMTLSANIYTQSKTNLTGSKTDYLTQNVTQIFTDTRDNKKYPLIRSKDRYWLNANLNFETENSNCLDDKESNCETLGRLYSWKEAQDVCPDNWYLPTVKDFRNLFSPISQFESGHETGLFTFPYTWGNFNSDNPAKIKISQNGMKHKKKYLKKASFNIWLRSSNEVVASHLHGYEYKIKKEQKKLLTIFPHNHEKKKPIQDKRKFGVRCVTPISEFNKLKFKND